MNLETKIKSILLEYSLRKDNSHVGSGLGGNGLYFCYTCNKKSVITPDVKDIDIKGDSIFWNPEFLEKSSKLEVRNKLDELVKTRIEQEGFKSPITDSMTIDESLISDFVKNIDSAAILNGTELPDLSKADYMDRLAICMRVCAKFAAYLDTSMPDQDTTKVYTSFSNAIDKFDMGMVLLSIRTQIGLTRLVNYSLDESKILGPLLRRINNSIE